MELKFDTNLKSTHLQFSNDASNFVNGHSLLKLHNILDSFTGKAKLTNEKLGFKSCKLLIMHEFFFKLLVRILLATACHNFTISLTN